MVVGPTGGGKTTVIDTLADSVPESIGINVKMVVMNPKAQTCAQLYGVMDPVTRDWTDGILSKAFREMNGPAKSGEMRCVKRRCMAIKWSGRNGVVVGHVRAPIVLIEYCLYDACIRTHAPNCNNMPRLLS